MKSKRYPADGLIVAGLALLVGGIGLVAAYRMFMVYDIPWGYRPLPAPPAETTRILRLNTPSDGNDPIGDTIYVTTKDGTVYSNTLFGDQWVPDKSPEGWDYSSWCVSPGPPADARVWQPDPPPVEKKVLDSAGFLWGSAFAINIRCYVLYRDGSLEVWTRQQNKLTSTGFIEWAALFGACGALVGAAIGGFVLLLRRSIKARATR